MCQSDKSEKAVSVPLNLCFQSDLSRPLLRVCPCPLHRQAVWRWPIGFPIGFRASGMRSLPSCLGAVLRHLPAGDYKELVPSAVNDLLPG